MTGLDDGAGVLPNSIQTLNLSFNEFEQLPLTLVYHPPQALTHLHLSGNPLGGLPMDFLKYGYKQLVSLDLHTCSLTRISPLLFTTIYQCRIPLLRLNLAINNLLHLPSTIGLVSQLQWFNLNDNRLTTLPASMANLDQLVKLGLVQNRLRHLPPFVFQNMKSLEKVDLRRNLLTYLPPSLLAIAPACELDQHLHLIVPTTAFAFQHAQPRRFHIQDQWVRSRHRSPPPPALAGKGGSLRTLLLYENDNMEHQDGIYLAATGEWCPLVSLTQLRTWQPMTAALELSSADWKRSIKRKWISNQHDSDTLHETAARLLSALTPPPIDMLATPNLLQSLHSVLSLKTIALQAHLRQSHYDWVLGSPQTSQKHAALDSNAGFRFCTPSPSPPLPDGATAFARHDNLLAGRLDMDPGLQCQFLSHALPATIPGLLRSHILNEARQCDCCHQWSTWFPFQVAYLARLCNNRMQVPVRFTVCSLDCALESAHRMEVTALRWHRQGTASAAAAPNTTRRGHSDNDLPLSALQQQSLERYFTPLGRGHSPPTPPSSSPPLATSSTSLAMPVPMNASSLASSPPARPAAGSPLSLVTAFSSSPPPASAPSSSPTSTTATNNTTHQDDLGPVSPTLTRVLHRMEQMASSLIQRVSPSSTSPVDPSTSLRHGSLPNTSTGTTRQSPTQPPTSLTFDRTFVAPSPSTASTTPSPPPISRIEFPTVSQLMAPRASLTSFNHLPQDAIRLERF
ncbi:hypothetical protein DM01DRAFT_308107 [Hesseltinella vesiculosa]|uniref:L domain-like protein n=1 Tax=Hesseltinella vesiculosa TaxID=101127 RepID=A0A1X2GY90_9FUNG|nr:hypothetical protein DM01DRAFT_308107 [Hesseltinella vesiculosa]